MTGLLVLLCCIILLPECVKLSLMPLRISLGWGAVCGIAGYIATIMFSGLPRQEAYVLTDIRVISTLEFIELMIMGAFLFSGGIRKKVLAFYPGLMSLAPIGLASLLFAGMFPGMEFSLAALIAGGVIAVTLIGSVLMLRHAKADDRTLYVVTVLSALFNIVIYGLV